MYNINIFLIVVILFVMAVMFALKMKYTGIALSIIDLLCGLMIMGIGGAVQVFTPFKIPLNFVNAAGIVMVVKGVYCLVLSMR